jgi:hypothetical protein
MNTKRAFALAGCLLVAFLSANCKDKPAAPAPATPGTATTAGKTFTGKVVETMNAASYTYVLVDTGKEKLWAAGPQVPMKVGDSVTVAGAMPMPQYHSKTLNRDFEVVYFASSLQGGAAAAAAGQDEAKLPAGHPPIGGGLEPTLPAGHPPIDGTTAKPKLDLAGLQKPSGGKTVQEVFAEKTALKGQPVVVRGKVVKYSGGIMSKNWLHIQDGTGAEGSNDLIVTTSAAAKVGDTVLVSGKVTTDKNFGFGYKFEVMIEDAQVTVE